MFAREFNTSKVLQLALGVLVFCYFVTFKGWMDGTITKSMTASFQYVCPRYFQSCEQFYVLEALPHGYSQTILYMVLFGILLLALYAMYRRKWRYAQLLLLVPFLWHAANVLLFTEYRNGNYEYYIIVYGLVLLFLAHKEFFLKFFFVFFYFLSALAKIHPAWIAGTYFSTLYTGLPLVPDELIPLATNIVIFMEMVGAWFLLSKHPILQRGVLAFFIFFHLYSGILVEYHYPAIVLPMLLVLFGPLYRHSEVPRTRTAVPGWILAGLLFVLQLTPVFIYGDEKLTLEANKYGLYMFESNHQCVSSALIKYTSGSTEPVTMRSNNARNRCDPYFQWFKLHERCERHSEIDTIEWTFDHSINGEPFLRIVDVDDVCALEYKPLSHNAWIKTYADDPPIVGYPLKNIYH